MSEILALQAQTRSNTGTGDSRELRRNGMVPIVIYGKNKENIVASIEEKAITKRYRQPLFLSQIFEIEVGGKKVKALPKSIDLHPITELVSHVDFVYLNEADSNQELYMPIQYINKDKSIGIKRGGYFNTVKRTIKISCPVKNLPSSLQFDLSNAKIGDSIKASQLKLPEGAKLLINPDFVIASIIGKKGKSTEEGEEGSEEAAK